MITANSPAGIALDAVRRLYRLLDNCETAAKDAGYGTWKKHGLERDAAMLRSDIVTQTRELIDLLEVAA